MSYIQFVRTQSATRTHWGTVRAMERGGGEQGEWAWLLRDCVHHQAAIRPTEIACVDLASGRSLDYRALDDEIARCAGFLAATLKAPGARVAILARNSLSSSCCATSPARW